MNKLIFVALFLSVVGRTCAMQGKNIIETAGYGPKVYQTDWDNLLKVSDNEMDIFSSDSSLGSQTDEEISTEGEPMHIIESPEEMIGLWEITNLWLSTGDVVYHTLSYMSAYDHMILQSVCKSFRNQVYRIRFLKQKTYRSSINACKVLRSEKKPLPVPSYIQKLDLTGMGFCDADAQCFNNISVKELNLSLNLIGDEAAAVLATIPALKSLNIKKTSVTKVGLDFLKEQNPQLYICHDLGPVVSPIAPRKRKRDNADHERQLKRNPRRLNY